MAFKFQGTLDNVKQVHKDFISGVLGKMGYKNAVVNIEPIGKAGDNYIADVKRIFVTNKDKPFQMVAKFAPQLELQRAASNTGLLFNNEYVMYTEVLPKLEELQKTAGIPKEERLTYPVCYGAYMEQPLEMILLEDLQLSNFVMLDRFKPLTDVTVRMVLKDFALLHSLSFVLKAQEPETFKQMKNKLQSMWSLMNKIPGADVHFAQMQKEVIAELNFDKHKKALNGLIEKIGPITDKVHKIDFDNKFSIIQQGDAWTNNIMFRFEGDQPVENIMIDYQLSRESSPVCDLLYMIFNCTDYETRSKHYYDWIDYYHAELDKNLNEFGMKANMSYPRDQLDVDLRMYSKFYLILGVIAASVHVRQTKNAAKVTDTMRNADAAIEEVAQSLSVTNLDEDSLSLFRKRVEGLIDSMYDYGYL